MPIVWEQKHKHFFLYIKSLNRKEVKTFWVFQNFSAKAERFLSQYSKKMFRKCCYKFQNCHLSKWNISF
jgi:hypothetical protein